MKILFRSDDYYLDGRENEFDIINIFNLHNAKITLGVIPFDTNGSPVLNKKKLSLT
jgi:hypothetical protein